MNYKIFKLRFKSEFHFGVTTLSSSEYTFEADTLFSALFMEALKLDESERFLEMVQQNHVRFSDAFPYIQQDPKIGAELYLPKPMLDIKTKQEQESSSSVIKKALKKLKYIPVEKFNKYLNGNFDILTSVNINQHVGNNMQVFANVRNEDNTLPYRVKSCSFKEDSGIGLYVILQYKNNEELDLVKKLFDSLSYSGIGGKRSSGKGRFEYTVENCNKTLEQYLTKTNSKRYMTLSISLPKNDEIENALNESIYTVVKRSGFVASDTYAKEFLRKQDLYMIKTGSCVKTTYEGDVYDVSANKGSHPVYRYGKPIFIGLDR